MTNTRKQSRLSPLFSPTTSLKKAIFFAKCTKNPKTRKGRHRREVPHTMGVIEGPHPGVNSPACGGIPVFFLDFGDRVWWLPGILMENGPQINEACNKRDSLLNGTPAILRFFLPNKRCANYHQINGTQMAPPKLF